MIEPLNLDFEVRCGAEHAFDVWTTRTSLWWPASHSVSAAPGLRVTIEPWVGGRIFFSSIQRTQRLPPSSRPNLRTSSSNSLLNVK